MAALDQLLKSEGFQQRMHALTVESVRGIFPSIKPPKDEQSVEHDWSHLLLSASLLSQYPLERAQATALRIAHHCLTVLGASPADANCKVAATIVLDILTNHPSIQLAVKKNLIESNFTDNIPTPLKLDMLRREVGYTVFQGEERVRLNRFQKQVYEALEDADCLSVSAPTSAGKSFVLEHFVRQFISGDQQKNIVFVVPTRALIQQVELDLQGLFVNSPRKPLISAVPQVPQKWQAQTNILVYTQERLQWLLNDAPADFQIDLLVVDVLSFSA